MEGLNGVIFVEAVHYFPFILINVTASLRNIDRSMEEAAQNLGASGFRLFRRIVFPLSMPGYVAGAVLVFVKVFDDLATPLLLNVKDMLAPQAYLRVTSIGVADPIGYVICVVLIADLGRLARAVVCGDRGQGLRHRAARRRRARAAHAVARGRRSVAYAVVVLILALVLAPHLALLLLSFATVWSFSPLPDGYTLAHYAPRVRRQRRSTSGTRCSMPRSPPASTSSIGGAIAYLVLRTRLPFRHWLDGAAMAALAVPGVVLGIGYLRAFYGVQLPGGQSLATFWVMIVLALAIRRLPYALRACRRRASARSASAWRRRPRTSAPPRRAPCAASLMPLMTGGILAGFVTSFATAAVELSATLMLVQSNSDAPLAYGIYVFMQSPAGRGAGAALGVIAVLMVAICTYLSHRVAEQRHRPRVADH